MSKKDRNQLGIAQRTFGMTYVRTWQSHRFDLNGVGYETQKARGGYDWQCENRSPSVLFQYTLAGKGTLETAGTQHAVEVGQAMLISMPSQTRYAVGRDPDWEFIWMMLGGDGAIELSDQLISQTGMLLRLPLHSTPVQQCVDLYRRLLDRRQDDCKLDEFAVNQLVHHWCLSLRKFVLQPASRIPDEVLQVTHWMSQQFADPKLRIEFLADAVGYSRFHFSRIFRDACGMSPSQYLLQLRMHHALELLTTTDKPIKQIAIDVGFEEVTWFTTTFKKHIGQTPGGVRKEQREMGWSDAVAL